LCPGSTTITRPASGNAVVAGAGKVVEVVGEPAAVVDGASCGVVEKRGV
jgi:hypothetical protein